MHDIGMTEAILPMLEMSSPEFFWTHIGKIEEAGGSNLRFYCCVQKGSGLEPVFTCVIPIDQLVIAARTALQAAAEKHKALLVMLSPKVTH